MLGEQFMVGSEVCGAVISVRFQVVALTDNDDPINDDPVCYMSIDDIQMKL